MLRKIKSVSGNLQFWQQLAIVYGLGILVLALVTSIIVSSISSDSVRSQLMDQGVQVAETLAAQSKIALLYQSGEAGAEAAEATLNFPDVNGVAIFTSQGEPVFSSSPELALPRESGGVTDSSAKLVGETQNNWLFVAPVSVEAGVDPFELGLENDQNSELVGYVLVDMSKESLHALAWKIRQSNIVVSLVVAFLLLLVLIAWSRRLTSPLERLSQLMHRACGGEEWLRADVEGSKDITAMQEAFNTMMEALERRNMELLQARDVALDSARTKGDFAANVSHELRTPLNGILGMLSLLGAMGLTHKQQEYVVTAQRSGESLLALIDDILSFSKVDSGVLSFEPHPCHLSDVLDEVVTLIGNDASRKGLELAYVVAPDVPWFVHVDGAKLRQVLVNLGGNAVKFTERGTVAIRVERVSPESGDDTLRFEVCDTGIGIPEEAQARVFLAFTQADASTTRTHGGTGLGLAIARELVNLMGGEIHVSSEVGRGSTFSFALPLQEPDVLPIASARFHFDDTRYRVIVVESCEMIARFLQVEFASMGIAPLFLTEGAEALKHLRKHDPRLSIVLMEENMEGLGVTDLRALLDGDIAAGRIIPVVLRNPWNSRFSEESTKEVRFLNKPLRAQKLQELLSSVMQEPAPSQGAVRDSPMPLGFEVLVVDDNHSNQLVAAGMLENLGCLSTVAGSGMEAIEACGRKSFDLVLMDCQMPGMDGFEATRQIRSLETEGRRTVIVAMTANSRAEDIHKCFDSGMDDFLGKPLKLETLREKLLHWLNDAALMAVGTEEDDAAKEIAKVFDRAVVGELKELMGETFEVMLNAFLEDTPVYMSSLKLAAAEGQLQRVRDLAHTIKGSAASFGAHRLVGLAREIQKQADQGAICDYDELTRELQDAFAELRSSLEALEDGFSPELSVKAEPFHIMVVDDDRFMRVALSKAVAREEYVIEVAENGQHALALSEQRMPDLILMDALMPEMDGFLACRRIRQLPGGADIPILMITGLEDEHSIARAFSSGATDYIPKPVHFAVLRQRIARLLQARRAEQHVKKLAYFDTLTGLPNRANLMQSLKVTLNRATANQTMVAVLFLDLDRFKLINDTLGHDVGDLLLKAAADRVRGCVRETDFVARLGGDEFTVVLQDAVCKESIVQVAEKICKSLADPFVFLQQKTYVSVSIGISLFPNDAGDITTLFKHADSAMFKAKESRNHYSFYTHGMEDEIARRIKLENELRQAIVEEQLSLCFQPQFAAKDNRLIGVEALLRWNHPDRGVLMPDAFVPLAEESQLINEIGLWVVRQACRQARIWYRQGHRLRVAINLSARDLQAAGLQSLLSDIIRQEGATPDMLEIEITETVLLDNPERIIEELHSLRNIGITLAIDDFGSGYSSLNYLRCLPVDLIKIDRSFVADLHVGVENRALVQGIIALTHSIGMKAMAEGVETQSQRDLLVELGCDYLQGYYFAEPLCAQEFEQRFLKNSSNCHLTILQ